MPYIKKIDRFWLDEEINALALAIAEKCNKPTDLAGNLNYAITRLIQLLPRKLAAQGTIDKELSYWICPMMYGVLLDVALEHKRRVNVAYEIEKMNENGDAYDGPYQTKE